jgi:hypothetical protein
VDERFVEKALGSEFSNDSVLTPELELRKETFSSKEKDLLEQKLFVKGQSTDLATGISASGFSTTGSLGFTNRKPLNKKSIQGKP